MSIRIDLRSDTVTHPTEHMRDAMANAAVGDDVYGDDPTVIELQLLAAKVTGKEAALYVPSGTMGNLISVLVHCNGRGEEYIVGDQAHIHVYEQGGTATLGGVHPRVVPNLADGTIDLIVLENAIRPLDDHFPITRLICLENTHNKTGGRVLTKEYIDQVASLCRRYNIALHMDGARLMNAVVASKTSAKDLLENCDSVSLCLSKALAAPVGSIIAGTQPFITQCRRLRKALGGGMRQCGIIAAAGIIALTSMVERLAIDHANAKLFAKAINSVPGLSTVVENIETNIVYVEVSPEFVVPLNVLREELKSRGILISIMPTRIRFVLHYQITANDVTFVVDEILKITQLHKTA